MLPAEGERKYQDLLRKKTGEERLKIALDLNRLTKKMMEDGIRNQFPHISPEEFKNQVFLRTQK